MRVVFFIRRKIQKNGRITTVAGLTPGNSGQVQAAVIPKKRYLASPGRNAGRCTQGSLHAPFGVPARPGYT